MDSICFKNVVLFVYNPKLDRKVMPNSRLYQNLFYDFYYEKNVFSPLLMFFRLRTCVFFKKINCCFEKKLIFVPSKITLFLMKSYTIFFLLMSFFTLGLYAQKTETQKSPKPIFRWTFPARLGIEISLGKNHSFYPKIGYVYRRYPYSTPIRENHIFPSFYPISYWNKEHSSYHLHGAEAEMEYRYYYNMNRRILKERNTAKFAANYFAVALQTGSFKELDNTHSAFQLGYSAIVRYGLQRNLFKNAFWGASFGVGYFYYQNKFISDAKGDLGLRVAIMVGLAK